MSRFTAFSLFAILVLALSPARAAEQPLPRAWFVDSLIKIFPGDAVGSNRLIRPELIAARGQHVSVQLAVRSSRAIEGVVAEVGPFKDAAGALLTGATVRREGFVVVGSHTEKTPDDELVGEAPGWFPDPLFDFPAKLEPRRTLPLWISVAVPINAQPGDYRGAVVLRVGDRQVARREIRLKVLAATVPSQRTLKLTNWFSLNEENFLRFYKIAEYSPAYWTLLANIGAVMAEHRQNMVITRLMDLIEPRVQGGTLVYDFAKFDRWVETLQHAGVIGYIEGSHLLGHTGSYQGPLSASTFQIEGGKVSTEELPVDDPRVETFLTGFLGALNTHLEAKGWKSIYYQHILDEPHGNDPPHYARIAQLVHRCLPGVSTMDAIDASHLPVELQKNSDVWVPLLGHFDDQVGMLQQRIASGHEVWFYTCLYPQGRYMNRLMDSPLIKVRLLQWLDFRYGFTGFLHWGWSYWTPDPILDTQPVINANRTLLPSGDAFIVYPDKARMSVYSSIRLETMLQGTEDYEMLMALKSKDPAAASHIAQEAITGLTDYVRDPQQFRSIERELLEALAK